MTNFKTDDEVWWFEFPEQCVGKMQAIELKNDIITYENGHGYIHLKKGGMINIVMVDAFHSKKEAIKAINKRIQQLNTYVTENEKQPTDIHCSHKSDGLIYYSNPPQNKCSICKEFYI